MTSMFESTAEQALQAEFKGFQQELVALKAIDRGFNYLVAQHASIHQRLQQTARALDRADPAIIAGLLRQRAQVLNEIASYLMEIGDDDDIIERRHG